jgi:hypothetical protein
VLEKATTSQDRPRQLIATSAQQAPVDIFGKMGKTDSFKRAIQRHRRGAMPKEPANLQVCPVYAYS